MCIPDRFKSSMLLLLLLFTTQIASAQQPAVPQFKDGDRVCFIGDSITHGGSYHSMVYLYYLTRFPQREIRIMNKGISGDQAQGALRRFTEDIATEKPSVSTLMLGMNDVGRSLYGANKSGELIEQKRRNLLNNYARNMDDLLARLKGIDSEVILITPSIYDQTSVIAKANDKGVNDALGICADYVKKTAANQKQGLVNFYDAMGRINAQVQRKDPSATIVGPDRIHPRPDPGHFIMGYLFLKAQAVPQQVSTMVLDARAGLEVKADNCKITAIQASKHGVSFTALEFALPFPQTESISKGLALVPFTREMNQETLSVKKLAAGNYALAIDDEVTAHYSAAQLHDGINLAEITKTPQYQQALDLSALNDQRHGLQAKLRDAAYTLYGSGLAQAKLDHQDLPAIEAFLAAKLKSIEGKPWYGYTKIKYDNYCKVLPQIDAIKAELEGLHTKLYQANQPKAHHFKLSKD